MPSTVSASAGCRRSPSPCGRVRAVHGLWSQACDAADVYGDKVRAREATGVCSAHGFRPEWLLASLLPEDLRDVDQLAADVATGMAPHSDDGELDRLAAVLADVVPLARAYGD